MTSQFLDSKANYLALEKKYKNLRLYLMILPPAALLTGAGVMWLVTR
jgi:hypothetical protein